MAFLFLLAGNNRVHQSGFWPPGGVVRTMLLLEGLKWDDRLRRFAVSGGQSVVHAAHVIYLFDRLWQGHRDRLSRGHRDVRDVLSPVHLKKTRVVQTGNRN